MTVNTFLEGFELKVDSSQLPACKQVLYVHFHIFKILIVVFFLLLQLCFFRFRYMWLSSLMIDMHPLSIKPKKHFPGPFKSETFNLF